MKKNSQLKVRHPRQTYLAQVIGMLSCLALFFACNFETTTTNMSYQGSKFPFGSGTATSGGNGAGSGTTSGEGVVPTITSAQNGSAQACNDGMSTCQFTCSTNGSCGPFTFFGNNFISAGNNSFNVQVVYQSGSQSASAGTAVSGICSWISITQIFL